MKDETIAAVDSAHLIKSLDELGVVITNINTLHEWSKQGLIPEYETGHQHRQMKKGRPKNTEKPRKGRMKKVEDRVLQKGLPGLRSKWPPETVEQAAAVWTLLHYKKGVTMDMVKAVKMWVSVQGFGGFATYGIPPLTRSLSGVRKIEYEKITLQLAPLSITMPDGSDGIEHFPGKNRAEKVQLFDELIKKWIATIAKVRYYESEQEVWPLDRGIIVKVVNRRIAHQRAWLWQFESLEIVGRTDPGEPDTILIFERADGDEKAVDTRKILVENINRAFGGS